MRHDLPLTSVQSNKYLVWSKIQHGSEGELGRPRPRTATTAIKPSHDSHRETTVTKKVYLLSGGILEVQLGNVIKSLADTVLAARRRRELRGSE